MRQRQRTLQMDMVPPPSFLRKKLRLRVHADTRLTTVALEITVNGRKLLASSDVSAFFNNPYDGMISASNGRLSPFSRR